MLEKYLPFSFFDTKGKYDIRVIEGTNARVRRNKYQYIELENTGNFPATINLQCLIVVEFLTCLYENIQGCAIAWN